MSRYRKLHISIFTALWLMADSYKQRVSTCTRCVTWRLCFHFTCVSIHNMWVFIYLFIFKYVTWSHNSSDIIRKRHLKWDFLNYMQIRYDVITTKTASYFPVMCQNRLRDTACDFSSKIILVLKHRPSSLIFINQTPNLN